MDRQTDGQMDGRMDRVKQYTPLKFIVGGIMINHKIHMIPLDIFFRFLQFSTDHS